MSDKNKIITTSSEWNTEILEKFIKEIDRIAKDYLKLDVYPNQFEIISAEQMLDLYSSIGLPITYGHWKFGKDFAINQNQYKKGQIGLSYEMVINCLEKDTLIHSQRGLVEVKDIKSGDKIWDGYRYVNVINIKKSLIIKGKKITLVDGRSIASTDEHLWPIITERGKKEVQTSQIKIGQHLLLSRHGNFNRENISFSEFDYIPPMTGFGEKFLYTKYCKIPDKMTPELAELIGIIIGDGSLGHTTTKAVDISIGWPDFEDGYLDYVFNLIKKVFGFEPRVVKKPSWARNDKDNYVIQIISMEIKSFFDFIGLKNDWTHKNKRIPFSIFRSDEKCCAAFLRGLFDTDGHIKNSTISFSSYNRDLAHDVLILLSSLGIRGYIKDVHNKHNRISGVSIFMSDKETYANLIGSSIKRKNKELLIQRNKNFAAQFTDKLEVPDFFVKKYSNKKYKLTRNKNPKGIDIFLRNIDMLKEDRDFFQHFYFGRVEKIEKIQGEFYDITVDSHSHYFIANGILTHNCNPCISYNIEENTTCLMALVYAHVQGHNAFFKNNFLFKLWTQADAIVDYMIFAKKYISECEEKYGYQEVEDFLDACHALMNYGVDKYKRPSKLSAQRERERRKKILSDDYKNFNDIWRTLPKNPDKNFIKSIEKFPTEPQENILYFIEKNAPNLESWQRELVRIVRKISTYFYPQAMSKTINEGFAVATHYHIINKMFEEGLVSEGFMLEFLEHHAAVVYQPTHTKPYYRGFNPYALGFNIFMDIKRICQNPTEEDRRWFPNLIGKDWIEEFHYAVENFKDDTFIAQYLSPKVIRDMKLFLVLDEEESDHLQIEAIHNDRGYQKIREALSSQYNRANYVPDIQIVEVDVYGDRTLTLHHYPHNNRPIDHEEAQKVLECLHHLWGFPVRLETIWGDEEDDMELIGLID